jgi:hypothetical protein
VSTEVGVDGATDPAHTKRSGDRWMNDADRAAEPIALIVVRTGAVDRFAALRAAFAPEGVDVVWDRRVGERRRSSDQSGSGSERRRRDRRTSEPSSWTLLDFLVVPTRAAVV